MRSLPVEIIANCDSSLLDKANIAFGVQYELARGVQMKRWSWADLTASRVGLLKGTHAEVIPKLNDTMGYSAVEPVHKMGELW
jgi:hypothetical protein